MTELLGVEAAASPEVPHAEFPKWIVPHSSHIAADGRAHGFQNDHVDRAGAVTVLVADGAEEIKALRQKTDSAA